MKKSGIATSAMEVITLKAPTPGASKSKASEAKPQLSMEEQMAQLDMCRKKVNNYRQPEALDVLIENAEEEGLAIPYKVKKVDLNIYAMIAFSRLGDEEMNKVIATPIKDLYHDAFCRYGVAEEEITRLYEGIEDTKQTTVEVNLFISKLIDDSIARANSLPYVEEIRSKLIDSGKLKENASFYNGTEIRTRALLYYATLPLEEKIKVIGDIHAEFGSKLNRFTGEQYNKRLKKLQEQSHVA